MSIVTVIVNNKCFDTTRETLSGSGYFRGIFELNPDESHITVHDRCDRLFSHVLNYLRDHEYPFPGKYYKEMEFYLIDKAAGACIVNDCYKQCGVKQPYCADHMCLAQHCINQTAKGSNYCNTHMCTVHDCNKQSVKRGGILSRYCRDHVCLTKECSKESLPHNIFCYTHWNKK